MSLVIVCCLTSRMIAGDDFNDSISSGPVHEEVFWSFWSFFFIETSSNHDGLA